jgi:hypothetical protein
MAEVVFQTLLPEMGDSSTQTEQKQLKLMQAGPLAPNLNVASVVTTAVVTARTTNDVALAANPARRWCRIQPLNGDVWLGEGQPAAVNGGMYVPQDTVFKLDASSLHTLEIDCIVPSQTTTLVVIEGM